MIGYLIEVEGVYSERVAWKPLRGRTRLLGLRSAFAGFGDTRAGLDDAVRVRSVSERNIVGYDMKPSAEVNGSFDSQHRAHAPSDEDKVGLSAQISLERHTQTQRTKLWKA